MINSVTYNNADNTERTKQLRTAKVEESKIAGYANGRFESLPADVQNQLTSSA